MKAILALQGRYAHRSAYKMLALQVLAVVCLISTPSIGRTQARPQPPTDLRMEITEPELPPTPTITPIPSITPTTHPEQTAAPTSTPTATPTPNQSPVGGENTYYIKPASVSGAGTAANPYGLPDLVKSNGTKGAALTTLKPGDTLIFLGGDYHLTGSDGLYDTQILSPIVSGTASQPITLMAQPGATVKIFEDSGGQPVFGTSNPILNYIRIIGFTIIPGGNDAVRAYGIGHEIAYNEVVGSYMPTTDNHDGLRIDRSDSVWVHHNNIYGVKGDGANSNGIKVYTSTGLVVEDNYIHDNTVGIHDKDAGSTNGANRSTYRRNWITNNTGSGDTQFLGNNQGAMARYYIYDNVIDGIINLYSLNRGSQIYNNLIRTSSDGGGRMGGIGSWLSSYQEEIWNNIVVTNNRPLWGYDVDVPFVKTGDNAPLAYMDYNIYDVSPGYLFNGTVFDLSEMRTHGFETHAIVVPGLLTIYQDLTSWQLKPAYSTAGRYQDPVGPRFPIDQILDKNRYGPAAH